MSKTLTTPSPEAQIGPASTMPDMREAAEQATELLRSIGSTHRLMILCLLMDGSKTVGEICETMDARQSLVSQHLTRLRLDGLVQAERQGHFVHYTLCNTPAREIISILHRHFCAEQIHPAKT